MSIAGKRILVVDDIDPNIRLIQEILSLEGAEVLGALNAEEGIALAREEQPHLILMDLQMPGIDGLTATRLLKADPQTAHIPIVANTAAAMPEDREKALQAGCDDYLTKPFAASQLIELVRDLATSGD